MAARCLCERLLALLLGLAYSWRLFCLSCTFLAHYTVCEPQCSRSYIACPTVSGCRSDCCRRRCRAAGQEHEDKADQAAYGKDEHRLAVASGGVMYIAGEERPHHSSHGRERAHCARDGTEVAPAEEVGAQRARQCGQSAVSR